MKRIAFVPDIEMESPAGEKYYRIFGTADGATTSPTRQVRQPDGSFITEPNQPWLQRQLAFMLERIVDPAFVSEGKDAIEAEILREEVRGIIKRQAKQAAERGYWELEDAHALCLANATMHPKNALNPAVAFNLVPFILAVRDYTTPEPERAEKSNGAQHVGAAS